MINALSISQFHFPAQLPVIPEEEVVALERQLNNARVSLASPASSRKRQAKKGFVAVRLKA